MESESMGEIAVRLQPSGIRWNLSNYSIPKVEVCLRDCPENSGELPGIAQSIPIFHNTMAAAKSRISMATEARIRFPKQFFL